MVVNQDKFNSYHWGDILFNLLFYRLNKDYVYMRNVALGKDKKKQKTKLKQKNDDKSRFQIYKLSFVFQVQIYDFIPNIGNKLDVFLNDEFITMLR